MRPKIRDPWSVAALLVGILLSLSGLWLIAAYALEAVIARVGEPDQSLLFWLLPFLVIGVVLLIAGVAIGGFGVWRRKRLADRTPDPDGARLIE